MKRWVQVDDEADAKPAYQYEQFPMVVYWKNGDASVTVRSDTELLEVVGKRKAAAQAWGCHPNGPFDSQLPQPRPMAD